MRESLHARVPAGVRRAFFRSALAAGLFASAHASAQDYAAREVGGWTVAASSDKRGCFITTEYDGDGETTLLLGLDIDGTNHLSVLNDNWSIKPKDRLKLNFRLSNGGYSNHAAVGMVSKGKKGFVTNFEAKFPTYFAASRFLHIYRGKVPVDQLSLAGSSAAVAELRRCVAFYRTNPADRVLDKGRSTPIPKDPFAER
ncbi:hypothetical protein ACMGDH_16250 [Sphingomonas sp. DT-207]|uniref:hypothetical protein n=1 Tax=Sphingomonas sp. DT-207 TaxID=3396167 RepID=UPI003F197092